MTKAPVVWVVSGEQWSRAYLRADLIERGIEAEGFVEIADALDAFREARRPKPHLIVLDWIQRIGERDEIAAIAKAGIPVVIVASATDSPAALLGEFEWAAVLRRPVTIGSVADTVEGLIRPKKSGP